MLIEKIDIGGIALIRAAAKNFKDVFCISDKEDYESFIKLYNESNGSPSLEDRKLFAVKAFNISSHYDTTIFNHFNNSKSSLKLSVLDSKALRYGENPHQEGYFFGPLSELLEHVHGKEISYNNLLDIDAAVNLMFEFYDGDPAFGILKHNNACGFAVRKLLVDAYRDALSGDPISAFGGVLISNKVIDFETATEINELFCEVVIAPNYDSKALDILKRKKNRIILIQKENKLPKDSTIYLLAPIVRGRKGEYKKEILNYKKRGFTKIKVDGKYLNIAAASVLAKTYRDDFMRALDLEFPQYGWKKNKGYPTKKHRQAIKEYGITEYHRTSFQLFAKP